MIPILYSANASDFTNNGLGALIDTISCFVSEERNGAYELELTYPISGRHYSDIANSCLIKAQNYKNSTPQMFRIYKITKPINGKVKIYAEHLSYRLMRIPVMPFSYETEATPGVMFDQLKYHTFEDCPFTFETNITTPTPKIKFEEPQQFRTCLGGVEGSMIDKWHGEFEWDNYVVRFLSARGTDRGVVLRYGKNIIDLTQEENIESTITGICPYWKGRNDDDEEIVATYSGNVVYSTNAPNYPYKRTSIYDFSQNFDSVPTSDQLRVAAQNYINENNIGIPDVDLTVSFIDLANAVEYEEILQLEEVKLCDTITIIFEALGVSTTAKVIKTKYDVLKEMYDSIKIGTVRPNLIKTINSILESTSGEIQNAKNDMAYAIRNATQIITGSKGGYKVDVMNEQGFPEYTLYMDAENQDEAHNVLKISKDGIGFSQNGVNGPFVTAWTIDGSFVANFITSGTLDADLVDVKNLKAENVMVSAQSSLVDKFASLDGTIDDLQKQIDGAIGVYYTEHNPTLLNYPAWDFTYNIPCDNTVRLADDLQFEYTFDSYRRNRAALTYNTTNGLSYRFTYNNSEEIWYWFEISNTETGLILQRISNLEVTTDGISANVGQIRSDLNGKYYTIEETRSAINQTASAINLEVSKKVNGTEIISKINQSAESIKISASKLDLQGYVTVTDLSNKGQTVINGDNINTGTISAERIGAGSFTITGGSINIDTSDETESKIQLNFKGLGSRTNGYTKLLPYGFSCHNERWQPTYRNDLIDSELDEYGFSIKRKQWNSSGTLTQDDHSYIGANIVSFENELMKQEIALRTGISTGQNAGILFYNYDVKELGYTASILMSPSTGAIGISNGSFTSDRRLKENIAEVDDLTSDLQKIKVKAYNFTGSPVKRFGVIAQEMLELDHSDRLVSGNEEEYYSVDYNGIIAMLVQGWQKHEERLIRMERSYGKTY